MTSNEAARETGDVVTSTPSRDANQVDFNEKLTTDQSGQVTSTAMKTANTEGGNERQHTPSNKSKSTTDRRHSFFEDEQDSSHSNTAFAGAITNTGGHSKGRVKRLSTTSFSSPLSPRVARFHLDESNEHSKLSTDLSEELGADGNELYEKLVFIVYKLIWEGIVGSNEDAWKVISKFIIEKN